MRRRKWFLFANRVFVDFPQRFLVYYLANKMCMLDTIRAKRGELYRIADRNKADKLYVFGSCAHQVLSDYVAI